MWPRKALRGGISKVYLKENLSTFGNKYQQNGPKNDKMAPRTTRRCPHEGPRAVPGVFHGLSVGVRAGDRKHDLVDVLLEGFGFRVSGFGFRVESLGLKGFKV